MSKQKKTIEIKSNTGIFDVNFLEILDYRNLIWQFVTKDFIVSYKQTVLGPAWAVLRPFLLTVVFTFIFGNVAKLGPAGVPAFIFYYSGNILWSYFSTCLTETSDTFVKNKGILSKVYFPRLIMPISITLSKLIPFGIQFIFLVFFIIYYLIVQQNINPNIYMLMTPLFILQLALLGMGIGIIITSVTKKYRDLLVLSQFIIQVWMYFSPITYDVKKMPSLAPGGKYHLLFMLNPITPVVNAFRYAFLGIGEINWLFYNIGWIITIFVIFIGVIVYNRAEKTFVDTI